MNTSRPIRNFVVAAAVAVASGTLCWAFLHRFQLGAADFNWALGAARVLLSGKNPYADIPAGTIPNPLPAVFAALPFAPFPREIAGGLFFGISSGLLALGLIRQSPERLLIFLAYPYWAALMTAQWIPLIMCAAFFPLALVFCIAEAPDRHARRGDSSFSNWVNSGRRRAAGEFCDQATMADGMDFPAPRIPAFRALTDCAGAAVGAGRLAMARP